MHRVDDGELDRLAAFSIELAHAAGELALRGRQGARPPTDAKSTPTDLVTEFDRAAEELIVRAIDRYRPDDGIVGEEGTDRPGTSGVRWAVDPIDGTTNYVYGLAHWCTSVAAIVDGQSIVATVHAPVLAETYHAVLGRGATCNGDRIVCGTPDTLEGSLVATGFAYRSDRRRRQAAVLAELIDEVRDVRRLGSAALDLCHVAAGRVDLYFETHLNEWDIAAGRLIAAEAGALVTDFTGGPPRPEEILAAAPSVHAAMVEILASTPTRP